MDEQKNNSLFGSFASWWKQPFDASGSAMTWILFVGLLIIAAFLWQTVLIIGFSKE